MCVLEDVHQGCQTYSSFRVMCFFPSALWEITRVIYTREGLGLGKRKAVGHLPAFQNGYE